MRKRRQLHVSGGVRVLGGVVRLRLSDSDMFSGVLCRQLMMFSSFALPYACGAYPTTNECREVRVFLWNNWG